MVLEGRNIEAPVKFSTSNPTCNVELMKGRVPPCKNLE
jgi:hypothetical protein